MQEKVESIYGSKAKAPLGEWCQNVLYYLWCHGENGSGYVRLGRDYIRGSVDTVTVRARVRVSSTSVIGVVCIKWGNSLGMCVCICVFVVLVKADHPHSRSIS